MQPPHRGYQRRPQFNWMYIVVHPTVIRDTNTLKKFQGITLVAAPLLTHLTCEMTTAVTSLVKLTFNLCSFFFF